MNGSRKLLICLAVAFVIAVFPVSAMAALGDLSPSNTSISTLKGTPYEPEAISFRSRVVSDGGIIVDFYYCDKTVKSTKGLGIWGNVKFLGDANMGVKLDASGVSVQKLYDFSGNNNDATQGTVANQPVWTKNVQGGRAGMVFDGTSDFFNVTPAGPSANWTFIGIAKASFVDANWHELFHQKTSRITITILANVFSIYDNNVRSSTYTLADTTNFHFYYVSQATTTLSFYVDGVAYATPASAGYSIGGSLAQICAYENGTERWSGPVTSVLIFGTALTTSQRTAIENMLNAYYSIY